MKNIKASIMNFVVQFICFGSLIGLGIGLGFDVIITVASIGMGFVTVFSLIVVLAEIENSHIKTQIREAVLRRQIAFLAIENKKLREDK